MATLPLTVDVDVKVIATSRIANADVIVKGCSGMRSAPLALAHSLWI
jgi:hypothetical protein